MLLVFNRAFITLYMESKLFGTISQSPPSLAFVPFFVILGGDFGINKLSTDRIKPNCSLLCQPFNGKNGDDRYQFNPFVEFKIIPFLCRAVFFCVLIFFSDILLRLPSKGLEALVLIDLLNTRSETK